MSTPSREFLEAFVRPATPAENMRFLIARHGDRFSPAEKREAQEILAVLSVAPDEALIQRIAQEVYCAWSNGDLSFNKSIRWAICEYIRRSAWKERR